MEIKRVGPRSVAKVLGSIYAAIGLLIGALISCVALVNGGAAQRSSEADAFGAAFGVGAIIMLPLIYGVTGVVGGALSAWLYNVFAGMVGGIEVQVDPPHAPTAP